MRVPVSPDGASRHIWGGFRAGTCASPPACADQRDRERLYRGLRCQDAAGAQAARQAARFIGVAVLCCFTHKKKATSRMGEWPLIWVGVAGFEPAASSSRSQVHRSARRVYPRLACWEPSMAVRASPRMNAAIVTQFVTHPTASPSSGRFHRSIRPARAAFPRSWWADRGVIQAPVCVLSRRGRVRLDRGGVGGGSCGGHRGPTTSSTSVPSATISASVCGRGSTPSRADQLSSQQARGSQGTGAPSPQYPSQPGHLTVAIRNLRGRTRSTFWRTRMGARMVSW
jgi:hypothetical protein